MKTKYHSSKKSSVCANSFAKDFPQTKPEAVIPVNCNYKNLPTWIEENFAKEIFLTGRAKRSLKKAAYKDKQLVYRAVKLLGTAYRCMKKGEISWATFKKMCEKLELHCEPTGTKGDDYNVDYGGKPTYLNLHLKKGSDHEPRNCLRIYFFWDADNELVVIGHLTSHLDNSKT